MHATVACQLTCQLTHVLRKTPSMCVRVCVPVCVCVCVHMCVCVCVCVSRTSSATVARKSSSSSSASKAFSYESSLRSYVAVCTTRYSNRTRYGTVRLVRVLAQIIRGCVRSIHNHTTQQKTTESPHKIHHSGRTWLCAQHDTATQQNSCRVSLRSYVAVAQYTQGYSTAVGQRRRAPQDICARTHTRHVDTLNTSLTVVS